MKPKRAPLPLALSFLMAGASVVIAGTNHVGVAHTFIIDTNDFRLDGRPFQIRCGEIHAARVPREYWRHRLQMARAMGLNTVCAYLFEQGSTHPGQIRLVGPGRCRRVLPNRATGRAPRDSAPGSHLRRRMGDGRPAVVAANNPGYQTPHRAMRVTSPPCSVASRKWAAGVGARSGYHRRRPHPHGRG